MQRMLLIGHRGAWGHAPENTLLSFQKAIELGADMIEFDVHALPTGELIIMHDDKVDRTSDGAGFVLEKTYEELRALSLDMNQTIPTLREALLAINKQVRVNIELKNVGAAVPVAQLIHELITNEEWSADMFMVSSFNHVEVALFRELMPQIKLGALISAIPVDYAAFAERAHADVAIVDAEFVTQAFIDDAHQRGLELYVYTGVFNDVDRVAKVKGMNADGMFVNFIDQARLAIG